MRPGSSTSGGLDDCVCGFPDYGFEYSDDEPEEEDVDIENQYYNSKGKAADVLMVLLPDTHQLMLISWCNRSPAGLLEQMLKYVKSAVTRNQSEKKINSLLDHIGQATDIDLLQEFYETTLKVAGPRPVPSNAALPAQ
eukprot:scaffold109553_cov45-Prasinocladus_malaysianus.AAC.2